MYMLKNEKRKNVPSATRKTQGGTHSSKKAKTENVALQDRHQPAAPDLFRLYIDDIRKYPLLSREDERDLAIRYREKGDIESAYKRLDVKEVEIVEMDHRLNSWEVSLDSPLKEDSEDTHKDFLPSDDLPVDDRIADKEAKAILHDKLMFFGEKLKGKEAVIFDNRLLGEEPMTLKAIGDKFGISRERVRQIESGLKKKLKTYLEKEITDIGLLRESMMAI